MMQAKRSMLSRFFQARRLAGRVRSRTQARAAPPPVKKRLRRFGRSRLALEDAVSETEL
jgi:hypothetical protein